MFCNVLLDIFHKNVTKHPDSTFYLIRKDTFDMMNVNYNIPGTIYPQNYIFIQYQDVAVTVIERMVYYRNSYDQPKNEKAS